MDKSTQLLTTLGVCATAIVISSIITRAGPLDPPAGAVTSTGVTLDSLAAAVSGADPCQCVYETTADFNFEPGEIFVFFAESTTRIIKRILISRKINSGSNDKLNIEFRAGTPGGFFSDPLIGYYELEDSKGSLISDIDVVVDGFYMENLTSTLIADHLVVIVYWSDVP